MSDPNLIEEFLFPEPNKKTYVMVQVLREEPSSKSGLWRAMGNKKCPMGLFFAPGFTSLCLAFEDSPWPQPDPIIHLSIPTELLLKDHSGTIEERVRQWLKSPTGKHVPSFYCVEPQLSEVIEAITSHTSPTQV